jgi:hypothetical protein
MPELLTNRKTLILDIEALSMIAGYAHWIPVTRGLYKDYFARNLPGWQWNQIIPFLIKKKIVVYGEILGYRHLSHGLYIANDSESVSLWIKDGETEVAVLKKTSQESFEE